MHKTGNFFSVSFLKESLGWVLLVFFFNFKNSVLWQEAKNSYPFCRVLIACIQPELIKLEWSCFCSIKPHITCFSFSEFSSIGFCNQGTCESKSFTFKFFPY